MGVSRQGEDVSRRRSKFAEPRLAVPLEAHLSDTAERDDPVRAWLSLPRRIYLDTSTLQNLYDFGGEIFEGEPFEPRGRAARVQGLADEIDALQMIFMVNQRAMFEF